MSQSPQVSIVIPTYNASRFILETVNAVRAQTVRELDILIVDDGSTDTTCDLVSGLDDRIRLFRRTNAGVSAARNFGLAQARAPFICFLDHDDVWHPGMLQAQLDAYAKLPDTCLIHTDYHVWRPDAGGQFAPAAGLLADTPEPGLDAANSGWAYHHLLVDSFILTSTAMMRSDQVREVGGFDVNLPYSEDWDLWLRLSRRWPFAKLIGKYALYRQLPSQGSRKFRPVDHRTALLENAVAQWGIASPDGSTFGEAAVRRQLADFHCYYGLDCLRAGDRRRAIRSILKALRRNPTRARYMAYLAATLVGWRPSW
jgi:glycosyltransferase involved in cell wall biosynthesis